MPLKSKTLSVSVKGQPEEVYRFVTNPENLPKWAAAFCKSVRKVEGEWVVETPQGPVKIRFVSRNDLGVADHHVSPAPGVNIYVPMRVVANGGDTEVMLTLFQQPDVSDEIHAQDIRWAKQDLRTLKEILER
jgi:hypothetical protein